MHRRLHQLGLVTATLLLSLTSTIKLTETPLGISVASVQAQTSQNRKDEAVRLNQLGLQQLDTSQFREALQTFEQALSVFREIGDHQSEGVTLNNIGVAYNYQGQYAQALKFYEQALVIHKDIDNKAEEGKTLNNIGMVYSKLGQYADALKFYEQALVIFKQIGDKATEGTTLSNMGVVDTKRGKYSDALKYYEQALVIHKEIGDKVGEGRTLNNIGAAYERQGKYIDALKFYEQALVIQKQIGNKAGEGTTLDNIAAVYTNQGKYADALKFYEQTLVIAKQIGDKEGEGTTLNNIGAIYKNLGKYADALKYVEQALVIAKQIGNKAGEGTTLNNIGAIYKNLGKYVDGLKYYQQALDIAKQIGDKAGEGRTLNKIGEVYNHLGEYAQALKFYQQALVIRQQLGDKMGEGTTLNNIGSVYDDLEQSTDALKSYKQALVIAKQIGDKAGEGTTLHNIGVIYNRLAQYSDAEKTLFAGIEVEESLRLGLSDTFKVSIFDTRASIYGLLQQALVAQNKTNTALEIAERGRARAFVELLAEKFSDNKGAESLAPLQPPIKPPKIQEIQRIAKEQNATLVEYSIVNDALKNQGKKEWGESLYIWIIKPTGEVAFKKIDLKSLNTSLENLVQTSRDSIGVRSRSIFEVTKPAAPDQTQRLQQLHKLLIEPIAQFLPTNPSDRVIFIPQNELFLVPFPALQDAGGKYLIEKHTILTAPAIQVLDLTRKQRQRLESPHAVPLQGKDMLIVGNPTMPSIAPKIGEPPEQLSKLPGAQREAEAIASLLNTKAITGKDATKSAIAQQMETARIIHLATHGLLDDFKGQGVPGAIALAPSGTGEVNDGLITSNEIFDMKLSAELVVLSACDTGRGDITGDGVIGLSRSLISAGVPSVIVSLWSVPDAPTASLMTEFYRQLQQNPDKATALRQAMLATMKKHPDPKKWAAFTLIGEAA